MTSSKYVFLSQIFLELPIHPPKAGPKDSCLLMLSSLENFPLDIPESTLCHWSHVYLCFAYFKKNAALQVDGTLGPKIHGLFISLNSGLNWHRMCSVKVQPQQD
jgi:hypothetical protein